ncbi:hypothetical protein D6D17_01308 [Aureobasidium pullulans]|uniref:Hyaluronan/mRNA-binding protein domain-containing protein n=1 Tax=Aureobasidium pullulans TaxID=5580 RepID=A0A4S9VJS0_AURPU|nr:hypothetical protein D6D27_01651 [Aureobasidium pullulans]THX19452.1 hypothetical protein D6D17_01308 [Aureobasidium pullulans]THX84869.1 hypothetical protein D6D04_02189 [Aureobasidium pullulans]THZ51825.1 hypothetical protein D6C90_01545 [Aureobasidium pullulans]TIA84812.1 hypothetical protein D6C76_01484 [Aureobasidium pullulans]
MTSVASKNLYELLGNDLELDPNREPEPPTKVMDKPVQRAGKRNAGPEAPSADTPKPAAGGRGGRQANFTGSEQAFRDKAAGASNNRSKPTDDGVRQDRHPNRTRDANDSGRGRGPRGGRGGARGPRTGRDDKHDRTGHAGSNDHAKQAGAAWGHETGTAELNDEKAAVADAKDEEAKEGIVADATVVDAESAPAQEEDNVKSYEQYLAEQLEKKAALGGSTEVRKPNEGASKKFPEGKAFARSEEENFIAPSAGKAKKQKERKDKNLLDIDQAWKEEQSQSQDSGFRGGRGGRGGDRPRGGPRGGRGGPRGGAPRGGAPRENAPRAARTGASPNVTSSSDFPTLGA